MQQPLLILIIRKRFEAKLFITTFALKLLPSLAIIEVLVGNRLVNCFVNFLPRNCFAFMQSVEVVEQRLTLSFLHTKLGHLKFVIKYLALVAFLRHLD